jgi:hypothetical protein
MALDESALYAILDAVRDCGGIDVLREEMRFVLQAPIDLEAAGVIGADRY